MSSAALGLGPGRSAYPERPDVRRSWLDEAGGRVAGAFVRRVRSRTRRPERLVEAVAAGEPGVRGANDAALRAAAAELRADLHRHGLREDLVARVFAVVREVSRRTLGMRHHDVQVCGGAVLLDGLLAEMDTGEGKTLTATLPAATAALAGMPVHVVTVNDYLAARDAEEMGPVYRALGLTVDCVQHDHDLDRRRRAYAADVTYVTNKEVAFDFLKDRIVLGSRRGGLRLRLESLAGDASRREQLVLRGLCFAIVDEADSVLVDEARTPLVISAECDDEEEEELLEAALELARELEPDRDFRLDERGRQVVLLPHGEASLAERAAGLPELLQGPRRRRDLVVQALTALHLFHRDEHYLVDDGSVQIIDEFTGRLMPDRAWERGLHQLIEIKEGCEPTGRRETLARTSYQRFFRRYLRLSGMTGTAREVAGELHEVYGLSVVRVPTHRPTRRRSLGETVHPTLEAKWAHVARRVGELRAAGRPVLVGTRSVDASETVARALVAAGIPHRVLNARQDREEAEVVAEAGIAGRVTVATNMAGRGTDVKLDAAAREAGGLHVIAAERHEAARIDRQLFGRCGRQGDPGSHESIVSVEDPLVRAHAGTWAASLPPPARVALAQRRAERLHAKTRRQVLKNDERLANLLAFTGPAE